MASLHLLWPDSWTFLRHCAPNYIRYIKLNGKFKNSFRLLTQCAFIVRIPNCHTTVSAFGATNGWSVWTVGHSNVPDLLLSRYIPFIRERTLRSKVRKEGGLKIWAMRPLETRLTISLIEIALARANDDRLHSPIRITTEIYETMCSICPPWRP
jgi:hypothetical protein